MSISACAKHDVKNSTTSTPVWTRRRPDGTAERFNPAHLSAAEAAVLLPWRSVGQSARSRNITVAVWSVTGNCARNLESGLEHDLHRRLDRRRTSIAVIPQPFQVELPVNGKHTPDLLQVHADGIRVWECKPESGVTDKVQAVADEMRGVCGGLGWEYELFTGMDPVERLNLMFLNAYRRTTTSRGYDIRPWVNEQRGAVLAAAESPTTIGALFDLDPGDGSIITTIWHLVASADLNVDLTTQLRPETPVLAQ